MRKSLLFILFIALMQSAWAQAPKLVNYQAVIRDASGHELVSKKITLQLSLKTARTGGKTAYAEVHQLLTNKQGLVNVQIGAGESIVGSFPRIDWGSGSYFLELGVDQKAGRDFRILGSTQMVSVPYALHAANVSYSDTSATNELQLLSLSGDTLKLSNGNEVVLSGISQVNHDNDSTNEIQVLSLINDNLILSKGGRQVNLQAYLDNTDSQRLVLSNDTLFISNGNYVLLPQAPSNLDNDSTNELQSVSLLRDSIFLSKNGGVIALEKYLDNTDSQRLALSGDTLFISNGNRVVLPSNQNLDNDSTNEIQVLSRSNDTLFLSRNNGNPFAVVLPSHPANLDNDSTNELQRLTFSNDSLYLSDGNFILLSQLNEDSSRIADRDGNTRVEVEANHNEDVIRFKMGGVQYLALDSGRIEVFNTGSSVFLGAEAGLNDDRSFNDNVFIGNRAGKANTGGIKNTAIGKEALLNTTTGSSNTALGSGAMNKNRIGYYNVAIGRNSLYSNVSSYSNIAVGYRSLHDHTTNGGNVAIGEQTLERNHSGSKNIAIGFKALDTNATGSENVSIGGEAMKNSLTGSENVALGFRAGYTNLGNKNIFLGYNAGQADTLSSNQLYIENSASSSPLIYGNFLNDSLKFNSAVLVRDELYLPKGAGQGKVLVSDAQGLASWQNGGTNLDNDSTNEIQDLQLVGNALSITKNGSSTSINLAPYLGTNTDSQQLSYANDTLYLSNGGKVGLNGFPHLEDSTRITDKDGDTKIQVEESPDEDIIRFDVAGQEKWRMVGDRLENSQANYLAIGIHAGQSMKGGNENTFVGHESGMMDSTGNRNTALGYNTLKMNKTGSENTAVGYKALSKQAGFGSNTAIGSFSLEKNTTGQANTSVGSSCMISNTTGAFNVAIGSSALSGNTSGSNNNAFGLLALNRNSSGSNNLAIGTSSMDSSTTGSNNAAFGYSSGRSLKQGSQNTYLGAYSNATANTSFSNSTALGYLSIVSASNQVRIGNSSVTSIGGQVGWTTVSDGRYKQNVKNEVVGLDFIMKLKPVTYNLNTEKLFTKFEVRDSLEISEFGIESRRKKAAQIQSGFVAQEVEQAAKEVGYTFSGVDAPKNENDIYGLRYAEFVVPLVKGMQEQQKVISDQQKVIEELMKRVEALEKGE